MTTSKQMEEFHYVHLKVRNADNLNSDQSEYKDSSNNEEKYSFRTTSLAVGLIFNIDKKQNQK